MFFNLYFIDISSVFFVSTYSLYTKCKFIFYHRYWRVLKLGIKSRRTKNHDDLDAVYCANNDICLLRLFESFLESAPQLLLQLYVIITFQHFDWIIGKVSSTTQKIFVNLSKIMYFLYIIQ